MQDERPQTLGEQRVRAAFNPSGNNLVDEIKAKTAELIDLCERHKHDYEKTGEDALRIGEPLRAWSLAQTHYEDAAMWAVKAATA